MNDDPQEREQREIERRNFNLGLFWVAMLAVAEPLGLDERIELTVGPLVTLARQAPRGPGERWTMHASLAWSSRHRDEPPEPVELLLWQTEGRSPHLFPFHHR